MCGIFGSWNKDSCLDVERIEAATNRIKHRGPDDEGYLLVNTQTGKQISCGGNDTDPTLNLPKIDQFRVEDFDLAFGFRRLAIIDLSPSGHQPMCTTDGKFWLIFNGEVYNYLDLRAELSSYGYSFHSVSDTEVVLAAYQHWGMDCLNHFNGMWAFAILDTVEKKIFIARDRFGIKPLYYCYAGGQFSFASEIKGLVGLGDVAFKPEDSAIYNYLAGGQLPSPHSGLTFFQDVYALPPAYWLTLDLSSGCLTKQRYWELPGQIEASREPYTVAEKFQELFNDSIRLHLQADVPVGTCLSGGVDSSSVVCAVNRLLEARGNGSRLIEASRQKTFSAVYHVEANYNERPYIDKVLAATHAEGNFVFPDVALLQQDIENLVWHQDEPFLSASIFAQYCVMRLAHERGVTVLLDGQGADEILAGYRPFTYFLNDVLRRQGFNQALKEAQTIQAVTGLSAYTLLVRSGLNRWMFYQHNPIRMKRIRQAAMLDCLQSGFVGQYENDPLTKANTGNMSLDQALKEQMQEFPLPHLLRYEDRNAMAHGIEGRVPFLDYRLVEYMSQEAAGSRIYQGWTKWPLREAMRGLVPDDVLWRRDKVGFETPEEEWLLQWQGANPDLFGAGALSGEYLNLDAVRKKITGWRTGEANIHIVWRWINFELWLRMWKVHS
jgi:asparagine synthase (glutamine-hydrolysing)